MFRTREAQLILLNRIAIWVAEAICDLRARPNAFCPTELSSRVTRLQSSVAEELDKPLMFGPGMPLTEDYQLAFIDTRWFS